MQFHARASMSARLALLVPGAGASRARRGEGDRLAADDRARGRVRRVTCTSAQILTWKKKNSYVYEGALMADFFSSRSWKRATGPLTGHGAATRAPILGGWLFWRARNSGGFNFV